MTRVRTQAKIKFRDGQRVRCHLPVGGSRSATVIDPDGKFGYKVDRRKVVPVRYDSGNLDCVPVGNVNAASPSVRKKKVARRRAKKTTRRRNPSASGPRIYVASLSDYTAGRLHGTWIEADADADVMEEEVAEMLAESKYASAEEFAIHDHEGFLGYAPKEYTPLSEIAAYMEGWDAVMDRVYDVDAAHAVIAAMVDAGYGPADWSEQVEDVSVYGPFTGLDPEADFAMDLTDAMGTENMGTLLTSAFDYARFGRDLAIEDAFADEDGESMLPDDVRSNQDKGEYAVDAWYGGEEHIPKDLIERYIDWARVGRDLTADYAEVRTGPTQVYFVRVM